MPLVVFTGYPSSGKSTWAKKLQRELQAKIDQAKQDNSIGHNYSITYHSDETLGIGIETYTDSNLEKRARSSQMSAVKRDLSRSCIVILDSLAYIKGLRYQLFCEAKGLATPHCVIHVINPLEICLKWNLLKEKEETKWDEELLKQVVMRYEEPRNDTRWDSPLFNIASDYEKEVLPIDSIWETLVLRRPPPPNAATVLKPTSGNNFLQELDKQTQDVVSKVIEHQQVIALGGSALVDREKNLYIEMPPNPVSTAQLQRIRRTYIGLNKMRSMDASRIKPLFVDYMSKSLNSDA